MTAGSRRIMMPLLLAADGNAHTIVKISGNPEIRKHLENLGFVVGHEITVISELAGNLIVNVKESRVGIDRELAQKVFVA